MMNKDIQKAAMIKSIKEITERFCNIYKNNPWLKDSSMQPTSISKEEIRFLYFFNKYARLFDETSNLHPWLAKRFYFLNYKENNDVVLYAERMQRLPEQYITKYDRKLFLEATIEKLVR